MSANSIFKKLDDHCKRHNISLPESKKEVLLILLSFGKEIEAEEVYLRMVASRGPKMSMATLYITLNWFVELGLVEKTKNKRINLYKMSDLEMSEV